jgi:hypothetical protein
VKADPLPLPRRHLILGAVSAALGLGLAAYVIGLFVFLLAGCGGGGSSGGGVAGPGGGSSFAGTTVTINPTLQFSSGGVITYTNTKAGSQFPAALAPVTGSYVYTPSADATSGTLVLTLPAPVGSLTFTLKNFRLSGGNVSSFETEYAGRTFQATVTVGTLAAKGSSAGGVTINNGGGSDTTPPPPSFPSQDSGHENTTLTL